MPGLNHYFRLHQAIKRIRKEAIAEYWEKENKDDIIAALTPRQMNYLMIIHKRGPCTLQEIMGLTGLSASASSAAVDKLVKLGILSRKTADSFESASPKSFWGTWNGSTFCSGKKSTPP